YWLFLTVRWERRNGACFIRGHNQYSDEFVYLALHDNQTRLTKFVAVVAVVSLVSDVVGELEVDNLPKCGRNGFPTGINLSHKGTRATIKAHPAPHHPPSPLQTEMTFAGGRCTIIHQGSLYSSLIFAV